MRRVSSRSSSCGLDGLDKTSLATSDVFKVEKSSIFISFVLSSALSRRQACLSSRAALDNAPEQSDPVVSHAEAWPPPMVLGPHLLSSCTTRRTSSPGRNVCTTRGRESSARLAFGQSAFSINSAPLSWGLALFATNLRTSHSKSPWITGFRPKTNCIGDTPVTEMRLFFSSCNQSRHLLHSCSVWRCASARTSSSTTLNNWA